MTQDQMYQRFMDGFWNCHDFMRAMIAEGASARQAEAEFASRWGEFREYDANMAFTLRLN